MKTFKDLQFNIEHFSGAKGATMDFPDGSFISVMAGDREETGHYCTKGISYEMLTNRTNRKEGEEAKGWLSPAQISAHMRYIQTNPKR